MYAVIRAGGKQYKVQKGDVLEVERLKSAGATVEFTPVLVVDDKGATTSGRSALSGAKVTANVLDETKGPKIDIFRYRNKSRYRRHTGHRQRYANIEISDIKLGRTARKTTAKKKEGSTDGS